MEESDKDKAIIRDGLIHPWKTALQAEPAAPERSNK
jgi:hypothetical protein